MKQLILASQQNGFLFDLAGETYMKIKDEFGRNAVHLESGETVWLRPNTKVYSSRTTILNENKQ